MRCDQSAPARADEINRPTLPLPPQSGVPEALIETDVLMDVDTSERTDGFDDRRAPLQGTFGEYELLNELGRGGMGIVFRARQTNADRIVALKIIRPDQVSDFDHTMRSEAIRRFQIEAKAAARLEHDHLVTVYDAGKIDGYHFYSMRFVPGESLADRIERAPLSGLETARLLAPVADAIHHAQPLLPRIESDIRGQLRNRPRRQTQASKCVLRWPSCRRTPRLRPPPRAMSA